MSERSEKLIHLSEFCNLETGNFKDGAFQDLELLYEKGKKYHRLCKNIRNCDKCPGMNVKRITEACVGWGNISADIFFVGQSCHEYGVYSGIPFILGSGLIIDAALRLSEINRDDCFWTNAVHCHPEMNRASTEEEKENCWSYLAEEIAIVQPKVVIALGKDAEWAVQKYMDERGFDWKYLKYVHPASLLYASPESRPNWIVRLSLNLDKALKK